MLGVLSKRGFQSRWRQRSLDVNSVVRLTLSDMGITGKCNDGGVRRASVNSLIMMPFPI